MLTTVPYDRLTPARLPWVTFVVALLWLVAAVLPESVVTPLALAPGAVDAPGLLGHWLLPESAVQLLVSVLLLGVLGPVLEEAWGPAFFAAFLVAMALYTAGIYATFPPDSPRPLVGGAGLLAATLGAVVARQLKDGIDYTLVFWVRGVRHLCFWVPAYALPGAWFAGEVLMELAADGAGPTRGLSYLGQCAGLAMGGFVGFSLRHFELEQRWLGRRPADAPDPVVEQAHAWVRAGDADAALRAIRPAAERRPHDPALVAGLCEAAVAAGETGAAKGPFLACVKHHSRSGEDAVAATLWKDWAEALAPGALEGRLALRLAEALAGRGAGVPAARLLRDLLDAPGAISTGMALRIVEIARPLHAGVAIRAATLALEGGDFPEAKRARLEAIVRELEARRADTLDPELGDAKAAHPPPDRTIEIAIEEEDLSRPPPEAARMMPEQIDVPGLSDEDEAEAPSPVVAATPPAPDPDALALRDDLFGSSEEIDLSTPEAAMDTAPTFQPVAPTRPAAGRPAHSGAPAASTRPLMPLSPDAAKPAPVPPEVAARPRFSDAKCVEVVPAAWQDGRLSLRQGSASPAWLDLSQVQAVATAGVAGLAARPVVLIDLLLNWDEVEGSARLRVLRLRSDRFDPARLLPGNVGGLDGFRAVVDAILVQSGATPLPDPQRARGRPFARFDSVERYEREVLSLER